MNKAQLVEAVAKERGIPVRAAAPFVESVLDAIVRELATGGSVSVTGFGVLDTHFTAAYKGRNPQSGAPVDVPGRVKVRFRMGRNLSDLVNDRKPLSESTWATAKAPKGSLSGGAR